MESGARVQFERCGSAAFALAADRDRLASTVHAQAADARWWPGGPVTFPCADVEGSTRLEAPARVTD
jgi:hypothetical protein